MAHPGWICPVCHAGRLDRDGERLTCVECGTSYPIVDGRPVLLAPDHPLFPPEAYLEGVQAARRSRWRGALPSPSVNLSAERCLRELGNRLDADRPRVLIVGAGSQRDDVVRMLDLGRPLDATAVDVDRAADVDAWCDVHDLPFADASFDAGVATAVLEHVLRPERVVAEIARVLRPAGLLYSEVPFMQQVHEGAYDFTRYTLSGHRRLLDRFEELDSGVVAGAGTALAWSLEHFALAIVRRPRLRNPVKAAVRVATAWLPRLDRRLADRPAALDGASCTYFLGRLRADGRTPDADIVARYGGAQRLLHV